MECSSGLRSMECNLGREIQGPVEERDPPASFRSRCRAALLEVPGLANNSSGYLYGTPVQGFEVSL